MRIELTTNFSIIASLLVAASLCSTATGQERRPGSPTTAQVISWTERFAAHTPSFDASFRQDFGLHPEGETGHTGGRLRVLRPGRFRADYLNLGLHGWSLIGVNGEVFAEPTDHHYPTPDLGAATFALLADDLHIRRDFDVARCAAEPDESCLELRPRQAGTPFATIQLTVSSSARTRGQVVAVRTSNREGDWDRVALSDLDPTASILPTVFTPTPGAIPP